MMKFKHIAICFLGFCALAVSCTKDVTSITVSPENLSLEPGQKYMLKAEVLPLNATFSKPSWVSGNASVVTVKEGEVTAVAPGSATVTASAGGLSATCIVTVIAKQPAENM